MAHRSVAEFALGYRPAPASGAEFGRVLALRAGHGLPRRRLHETAIAGRHGGNVVVRIQNAINGVGARVKYACMGPRIHTPTNSTCECNACDSPTH